MISVSLFLVIIMSGMGALLNANLLHQKSRDMRSIMDNLSFIMEDMSRNLRTGYGYRCLIGNSFSNISTPSSCLDGQGIAFESASTLADISNPNNQWVYSISEGKIFKSTTGAQNFYQLTPEEIIVDPVSGFAVLGAESPLVSPHNYQQPFVTIRLVGKIVLKNNVISPFSLQTSVSQRLIDI